MGQEAGTTALHGYLDPGAHARAPCSVHLNCKPATLDGLKTSQFYALQHSRRAERLCCYGLKSQARRMACLHGCLFAGAWKLQADMGARHGQEVRRKCVQGTFEAVNALGRADELQ